MVIGTKIVSAGVKKRCCVWEFTLCEYCRILALCDGGMLSMLHDVGQVQSKVVKGREFLVTIS